MNINTVMENSSNKRKFSASQLMEEMASRYKKETQWTDEDENSQYYQNVIAGIQDIILRGYTRYKLRDLKSIDLKIRMHLIDIGFRVVGNEVLLEEFSLEYYCNIPSYHRHSDVDTLRNKFTWRDEISDTWLELLKFVREAALKEPGTVTKKVFEQHYRSKRFLAELRKFDFVQIEFVESSGWCATEDHCIVTVTAPGEVDDKTVEERF